MTDKLRAAMQAALELCDWINETPHQRGSINGLAAQVGYALRDALAEQEDAEPVAYIEHHKGGDNLVWDREKYMKFTTPLYTTPPRREWVGLTDEERIDAFYDYLARTSDGRHLFRNSWSYAEEEREAFDAGVAVAEAGLKEKNHDL